MAVKAATFSKPQERSQSTAGEVLYLIKGHGLEILMGKEGDWVREKIKADTKNGWLPYRLYDDDKRTWATWAVLEPDGQTVKPIAFPDPSEYGMTPPELFTKAVTYPSLLSRAVTLLRQEKLNLWDKMMKPTTVIIAIVVIVLFMGMILMAAKG